MLLVDTHYLKDGKDIHHLGINQTFVAPQRGPSPRLQVLEAPGADENAIGVPAIGGSGAWLNILNRRAGLKREDLNIANCIQCQPPNNIYPTDPEARSYISKEDAENAVLHCYNVHLQPLLHEREWKRVDIFGDKPLRTLTGKTEGILKWRGSPLPIPNIKSEPITVPTVHPAYIARNQLYSRVASADLAKGLVVPPENYNLKPDLEEVRRFTATKFALDIETDWGGKKIFMVGLSAKSYHALVVPFQGPYIAEIKRIILNAEFIITQNGIGFDMPILCRELGITWQPK